jgi:peptide/nickel transport system permease protein
MIAGYRGGRTDTFISRAVDIVLSLPLLVVAIGMATVCSVSSSGCLGGLLQPGLTLVIGIIALFTWPNMARLVRGQALTLREKEFIEAARSLGAGGPRIMFRELLPNLLAPIVVYATLLIPANILFEAALSFLGVGVPQSTPSWGRMLADASAGQIFTVAWWMMLFPGLFLIITTLSFNLVGDGLRDALGPAER